MLGAASLYAGCRRDAGQWNTMKEVHFGRQIDEFIFWSNTKQQQDGYHCSFFIIYCNPNTLVTVTARGVRHVMLMQHFYMNVIHTFIKHGGAGSDDLGLFCSHRTWEPFQSLSLPWTPLECSREYSRVSCEPIYWTVKAWLELSAATEQWSQACHQICNRCVTCIRCKCVTEWLKKKRIKVPQWHLTRAAQI